MTIGELETKLRAGAQLDQLFDFTAGQCCQIYKAKNVERFDENHDIIYIPDTSLNEIPTDRPLDVGEINAVLEFFFTGYGFMETCLWDEHMARRVFDVCDWQLPSTALDELRREDEEEARADAGGQGETESKNVFVEADSFRRLLLGAAGGYELQGYHEATVTVMHVIDALDELTTGGKGKSQADEDREAAAAAETIRIYCEKCRRKANCCGDICIFDKDNDGPLCPLTGSPMGWDGFGENGFRSLPPSMRKPHTPPEILQEQMERTGVYTKTVEVKA